MGNDSAEIKPQLSASLQSQGSASVQPVKYWQISILMHLTFLEIQTHRSL